MPGYKITVGDAEIISITDCSMQFPWSIFFPNVPLAEIEAYSDLYPQCYGDKMFKTDAGAYAVRSGGKTLLVDTGLGPGPIQMLGGIEGHLVGDMKSKGIAPEDVDIVVHTHLHLDHVGWNMTGGAPTFPNATYYAPEADIEFFFANKSQNPHIEQQVEPLQKLGKLESYTGEVTSPPTSRPPRHPATLPATAASSSAPLASTQSSPATSRITPRKSIAPSGRPPSTLTPKPPPSPAKHSSTVSKTRAVSPRSATSLTSSEKSCVRATAASSRLFSPNDAPVVERLQPLHPTARPNANSLQNRTPNRPSPRKGGVGG